MRSPRWLAACCVIIGLAGLGQAASKLEKGESLTFFLDYAWLSPDSTHWTALVHGWDYTLEPNPKRREQLAKHFARSLGISETDAASPDFQRRSRWFMARSHAGRVLHVRAGGKTIAFRPARGGGHIHEQLTFPHQPDQSSANRMLWVDTDVSEPDGSAVSLPVQRLGPEGMMVIASLDDALKVTGLGDKKAFLANELVKPYEAVPGMPALLRRWATQDKRAAFIYLSAAPWQLYHDLTTFLHKAQFPKGLLRLKHFQRGQIRFDALWQNPEKFKAPILEELFKRFPKRKFILVGNTAEKDPEIFGQAARRHLDQVLDIYIRELADTPESRYEAAFKGIDPIHWHHFRTVQDLGVPQ